MNTDYQTVNRYSAIILGVAAAFSVAFAFVIQAWVWAARISAGGWQPLVSVATVACTNPSSGKL